MHLRRPAVLSRQEGVFVPKAPLAEVDCRWEERKQANPALYDGRLYHVLGVHRNGHGGATIHVVDCAYRFHAVQDEGFDLGVRPLGVKGFTRRDDRVLMGKRSRHVHGYQGLWEFAPGGVVEPAMTPEQTVIRELQEETGLTAAAEPIAMAIIFDDTLLTWEIIYRLDGATGELQRRSNEYDDLAWRQPDDLTMELTPLARRAAALLRASESVQRENS